MPKFQTSNKTIEVYMELTGMTFEEYKAALVDGKEPDPFTGDWGTNCPDSVEYKLETELKERNPLCVNGTIKTPVGKTLMLTMEGGYDTETTAGKYLHQNFLTYDGGLVKIVDYLSDPEYPQIYVGYFTREDLVFPREGGEDAAFNYEGSSGDYIDITQKRPVTP